MKKEKQTLQQEVASRKFKKTNPLYYFIYRTVMTKFVGRKYHAHYEIIDDIRKEKGPCFIIWNHLSRLDHIYVMEACWPKRMNMLAGYNEFFRSHLYWAFKKNNVIPKKNYTNDLMSIKGMSQIIKKGGIVALAPEGLASVYGTNKPVVPGTGHLFKHFNIPVYFLELRGQHLLNTHTCLDERYGETYAKLQLLFTPEDLKNKTDEELDNIMNEKFRHDEYAWQKEKHILWKSKGRNTYHLQDLLYRCPKCGAEFQMETHDNEIQCKACGNGATLDDYYDFHPYEGSIIPETISRWADDERIQIIKDIRRDPNYTFTQHVKIGRIPKYHLIKDHKSSEICGEGTLTIDHTGMHYDGTLYNEPYKFDLDYKKLYTLIFMLDMTFFDLYVDGEYTDIFPDEPTSGKIYMLVEEMHRLHVNYYKNFPWNDYMYKDLDK